MGSPSRATRSGWRPDMNPINVRTSRDGATVMHQLIHEALSRARMRRPQAGNTTSSEATRSARHIAMQARRQAAREMGLL